MSLETNFSNEKQFLYLAQKLKSELRHCHMKSGRCESVDEHSWRLGLMAMRYAEKLDQKVDIFKCIKIALVDELPEVISGDIAVLQAKHRY